MSGNEQKLFELIARILGVDAARIDQSASIDTIEEWDSLNHIKIIISLEEAFSVSFSDEQTVEMLNILQIKTALESCGVSFQ